MLSKRQYAVQCLYALCLMANVILNCHREKFVKTMSAAQVV